MMTRNQIIQLVRSSPQLQQAVAEITRRLQGMRLTPELVKEVLHSLEFAIKHPDKYPQIRAEAIKRGFGNEQTLPAQYDQLFIMSMMVAFYGVLDQLEQTGQQELAKGGLANAAHHLQAQGRGGDTILAHINPAEAEVLRRMGGSGTVNPHSGLTEFKGGVLGEILSVAAPVATMFVAPYLAPMLGGSMLAAGTLTGGLASAMTGGNPLQGAAVGALGQGLGGTIGGALAPEMSAAAQNAIGSGLMGGVVGAATGQGALKGAAQGALGSYLGSQVQGAGGQGAFGQGLNQAGTQFGNMMAAGYSPQQAALGGGLAGLAAGFSARPSDIVSNPAQGITAGSTGEGMVAKNPYALATDMGGAQGLQPNVASTTPAPATSDVSDFFGKMTAGKAMLGASVLSALQGAPQPVQQAVSSMSPEQQAYFNRPSVKWDWNKLQQDATNAGMDLTQYMAQNWNKVTSGQYNQQAYAQGGLSQAMALMSGGGSGRDDTIDAKLSDGEYVMDAETVAMLGDGSVKEGARKLDLMRQHIRQHKGKMLARGKISPNAKSAQAYLKGVK